MRSPVCNSPSCNGLDKGSRLRDNSANVDLRATSSSRIGDEAFRAKRFPLQQMSNKRRQRRKDAMKSQTWSDQPWRTKVKLDRKLCPMLVEAPPCDRHSSCRRSSPWLDERLVE